MEIKSSYDILAILSHYNLVTNNYSYDLEIKIICPFHEETKPSCSVSLVTGVYYCFGCGKKGNIVDLVAQIEKVNKLKAMQIVTKLSNGGGKSFSANLIQANFKTADKKELLKRAELFFDSLPRPSWDVMKNHYLFNRGFNATTLKNANAKINQSSIYPIIIPLLEQDVFKGYVLRKTDDGEPKYLFSRGLDKHNSLIGKINDDSPVMVVEGTLDLLMAKQFGYENVCSLLGWSASDYHLEQLGKHRKIISALDNDSSGERGYKLLKKGLKNKVIKFKYPEYAKDICDLDAKTFVDCIKRCWA
jgi:DNA primase